MADEAKIKAVRDNYAAFVKLLPGLLEEHAGKFALLRDGKVEECFDSARDAFVVGESKFKDGLFSVQEVTAVAADLGWYSRAANYAAV